MYVLCCMLVCVYTNWICTNFKLQKMIKIFIKVITLFIGISKEMH